MNINLIISTYAGKYSKYLENDKEYYLKYLLACINKLKTNIAQITIMRPKVNDGHTIIKDYYNFDNLNLDNIKSKIKIYDCENIGISYGQFITGISKDFDLFDYFIFLEDDYIPFVDYFEELLINEYIKNEGESFLCLFHDKCIINYHNNLTNNEKFNNKIIKYNLSSQHSYRIADFSLGIISKKSMESILYKFSSFENIIDFYDVSFSQDFIWLYQVQFSYMLNESNVKIYDIKHNYLNIFYDSYSKSIKICNKLNTKYNTPLFIPTDILFPNTYNDQLVTDHLIDNFEFNKNFELFNLIKIELMKIL